MTIARIRFATDIIRRLGEELNPSPDQSVLELVKNSYDADATECVVELIDTDEPGGAIRVSDNGSGMEVEDIRDGWLVLGTSSKRKDQRTRLGRIPAGSKGLGRLAALRMGTAVSLVTCPSAGGSREHSLEIDWNQYDSAALVDDVELEINTRKAPQRSLPGSRIEIRGLRESIGRMDVKRLARSLVLLADPFGDDPSGFQPRLNVPEYVDLEKLVRERYFQDAEYHLHASTDKNGRVRAEVTDWKGARLFVGDHAEIATRRSGRVYGCPSAKFDLWIYLLNSTAFTGRSSSLSEVREWLDAFGGVHLYENGLRVSPYGNPGNDWLDMNLSRARSPEERPSTNTSIGRVSVVDTDGRLLQKTDRSGFIETEDFQELRAFAQDTLEWLASRRMEVAVKRRAAERAAAPKQSEKTKKGVQAAIEKAPKQARSEITAAFHAYDKSREREMQQLRREVQLYRTLSTAGITAATFAHESSGNPIKSITHAIESIETRAKRALGAQYVKLLDPPVQTVKRAISALAVLGRATLRLLDHEKRRLGRVNVHDTIRSVLDTFDPFLQGRDVSVELDLFQGAPYLRGSEAAVESVVTNLLNNSLAAFERASASSRRVLIRTRLEADILILRVSDNGPGIVGISVKDVWLPGQTTQPNGTGLGLAIVHDAVADLGGGVEAIAHGELGGAEIVISVPLIGH